MGALLLHNLKRFRPGVDLIVFQLFLTLQILIDGTHLINYQSAVSRAGTVGKQAGVWHSTTRVEFSGFSYW